MNKLTLPKYCVLKKVGNEEYLLVATAPLPEAYEIVLTETKGTPGVSFEVVSEPFLKELIDALYEPSKSHLAIKVRK